MGQKKQSKWGHWYRGEEDMGSGAQGDKLA